MLFCLFLYTIIIFLPKLEYPVNFYKVPGGPKIPSVQRLDTKSEFSKKRRDYSTRHISESLRTSTSVRKVSWNSDTFLLQIRNKVTSFKFTKCRNFTNRTFQEFVLSVSVSKGCWENLHFIKFLSKNPVFSIYVYIVYTIIYFGLLLHSGQYSYFCTGDKDLNSLLNI